MCWCYLCEGLIWFDLFIFFVECLGLIVLMMCVLMCQVVEDLGGYVGKLELGFYIGFNISVIYCYELVLVDDCCELLVVFLFGYIILVLELIECELIELSEVIDCLFDELYVLGVKIVIDDFGIGYFSLVYLCKFQVDCLKIDQSFVVCIGIDIFFGYIFDSIVELFVKFDLDIVVEGVEIFEQCDYLVVCGVDYLQGYLIGWLMLLESLFFSLIVQEGQGVFVVVFLVD